MREIWNQPVVAGTARQLRAAKRRSGVRSATVAVSAVLLAAGTVVLGSGTAEAASCGNPVSAGSDCSLPGTLTLTAGSLTLASPASLDWEASLTGADQSLVGVSSADQEYTVNDSTGSGAGWDVTATATTFTNGSQTLPNTGTLVTNGSVTSVSATGAPTAACAATTTCTLPTDTTTYPVGITTAPTAPNAVTIYSAAAGTGVGQVVLGGIDAPNPVGWWINVPASAFAGAYTSTVTMAVVSAP